MAKIRDFGASMQIHEQKHKSKPEQFVSVDCGKQKRIETYFRNRKTVRLSVIDEIRNFPRCESPAPTLEAKNKVNHRRMQLEKWKEEKEKERKQVSLQKKKPFVVGVPHYTLSFIPPPPLKSMPSTSGRVTRSQSFKNNSVNTVKKTSKTETKSKSTAPSFAPKEAAFHPPVINTMDDIPILSLPMQTEKKVNGNIEEKKKLKSKILKENVSKQNEGMTLQSKSNFAETQVIKNKKDAPSKQPHSSSSVETNDGPKTPKSKTSRKSLQSKTNMATLQNVPKIVSSSEEQIAEEAKNISPCVTIARGKDNARKEMNKKLKEGLLDEYLCEKDNLAHFRWQMDSQVDRMTKMCETWEKLSQEIELPETVQEAILSAVGQARLLMSQKLQQFASLLSRCEHLSPNSGLVTPSDLHGFWDMVFMQIENVDMRFRILEEFQERGWSEDQSQHQPRRPAPRPARPAPAARSVASRFKDIVAAARKAKQAQPSTEEKPSTNESSMEENKNLDVVFFCVNSPVKSPLQATPCKPSLLKAVLSNDTEKLANRRSASYAMLRASLIGRQVESGASTDEEHNLITFTPVQLGARLVRKNKSSTKKSGKRYIKVMLFDDSDSSPQNTSITDKHVETENDKHVETENDKHVETENNKHVETENDKHVETENDIEKPQLENNGDSGISSRENKRKRKSRLTRQDATEERSPIMTRSRRRKMLTPGEDKEERSRTRKKRTL